MCTGQSDAIHALMCLGRWLGVGVGLLCKHILLTHPIYGGGILPSYEIIHYLFNCAKIFFRCQLHCCFEKQNINLTSVIFPIKLLDWLNNGSVNLLTERDTFIISLTKSILHKALLFHFCFIHQIVSTKMFTKCPSCCHFRAVRVLSFLRERLFLV